MALALILLHIALTTEMCGTIDAWTRSSSNVFASYMPQRIPKEKTVMPVNSVTCSQSIFFLFLLMRNVFGT